MSAALIAYYAIPAIGFICLTVALVVLAAVIAGGRADDAMDEHFRRARAERARARSRNRRGF